MLARRRMRGRRNLGRAGLRWSPAARETVERRWTAPAAWRKRRNHREGQTPATCNTHVNPHTHTQTWRRCWIWVGEEEFYPWIVLMEAVGTDILVD